MHVRLYDGPCQDGYIRGKQETLVWAVWCPLCSDCECPLIGHMPRVHEIQHPEPGPAMDWARMHHWQHQGIELAI